LIELGLVYIYLRVRYGLRLMRLSYDQLDSFILHQEKRWGSWRWSLLVAIGFLLAACLYVRPGSNCAFLGQHYAAMAAQPFLFDSNNPCSFRILTPLISWLLGFGGCLIVFTNLIITTLLLREVYSYFRSVSPRPGDALIATASIAFSMVVLLTVYYAGYCDAATYLIIFLMWRWRQKPVVFYSLFLLSLFNRESIIFIVPWFVFLTLGDKRSRLSSVREMVIGYGASSAIYLLFRAWVSSHQEVAFSIGYYLDPLLQDPFYWLRHSWARIGLGLFSVFKALWIVPIIAGISLWQRGERRIVYGMCLLLGCTLAQFILAYDSSRLGTLAFMVVIISLKHLFEVNPFGFRNWIGWVMLFNLAIPQVSTANKLTDVMLSPITYTIEYLIR